ncbi:MAG: amidase [Parasphingorhabdus sp.]
MLPNLPSCEFTGSELCELEAHVVVDKLRNGEISSEDLVAASLARIESVEPAVNAMPTVCGERAYEFLKKWRADGSGSSQQASWLGGLPIAIKDLNEVAGVRTTYGTPALAENISVISDPLVERLESNGALVVGKTNTPEMGAGGNTFNSVFGMTRNPWDTSCNAGGSSGGAAVSLATGEVWLSHGSDLAGSLRTPAAYCGVVGFRPSPGRAGGAPKDLGFNMEAVSGPMARSVTDCALFLDAMSGFDPRLPLSYPAPTEPFQQAVRHATSNIRVAYSSTLDGFAPVSRQVDKILRQAMDMICGEGGEVEEQCPELPDLDHSYRVLRGMLWAAGPGFAPEKVQSQFKYTLMDNIDFGRKLTIEDLCKAQRERTILFRNMRLFLENFDVLACPTVGLMPGPVEEEFPTELDGEPLTDYIEWLRFSYLSTATSLPSLSMPVGFSSEGLPVGLQLIGPPRGEAKLLAVARAIELAVGGPIKPIDPNINH